MYVYFIKLFKNIMLLLQDTILNEKKIIKAIQMSAFFKDVKRRYSI